MKLIAHRGGAGLRVENTLAAFEHAVAVGADGAELDVHLSRDRQVVVHHDDRLNLGYCRHADGDWIGEGERLALSGLTFAEMRAYEIGVPRPGSDYARRFDRIEPVAGQRIPLLRDVIRLVKARSTDFFLVIEIKASVLDGARKSWVGLADATLAIVDAEGFASRAVLCSFDWGVLLYARERCRRLATWFTSSPLSWWVAGQPPAQDLPPDDNYLQAARKLYDTGDAPWFAGFDPRRFAGGYPEAVAAAGGDAWFPYYRDCTTRAVRDLAGRGLVSAAWSANLRDRRALDRLIATGVGNVVVDYPDMKL